MDSERPTQTGSDHRVRLIYVISTLDIGGAEGQFGLLAERLNRSRFEVMVITLGDESALSARLRESGIPVVTLRLLTSGGWHGSKLFSAVRRLVTEVQRFRPAIVHGVLIHGYVLGGLAARLCRVPTFISSRRALASVKTRFPPLRLMEGWVNRFTRVVVANSEAVRQDTIRTEGLPASQVCVIRNGIGVDGSAEPANETLRTELHLQDREPIVAVVSNFIRYKGHVYFCRAFASLVADQPRAAALLIGEGPERPASEALARELGIDRAVHFLGRRSDVGRLLRLADIVVHPSLTEGFSNAILEAMAASKPVIATRVGGNAEAVIDGVTGFLVRSGDADALLTPLRVLTTDPSLRREMGAAGRQRILMEFTVEKMIREYEQLYEKVLADQTRSQ